MSSYIIGEIRSKGLELDDKPGILNILGIRRFESKVNYFDDLIGYAHIREDKEWVVELWNGSTRPGLPSMLKPVNPKGTAILVPGQYKDAYSLGIYKNATALKQVKDVRVYRDADLNKTWDPDPMSIESGYFGIHIHRAGLWSRVVGPFSAGCQVFQKTSDFKKFIDTCSVCHMLGQKSFTYTLIEI